MKKWLKRLKEDERGLTLVELLAVIVILAIVGAIAFVSIGNIMDNSRKDAHIANAQQMISAAKLYDASVQNLESQDGQVTTKELQEKELLGQLTDPWGKATTYEGTVTKEKGSKGIEYKVTITRSGGEGESFTDEYKITDATETMLNGGREKVWQKGS